MQKAMQRRVPWFPILLAIGWMVMTGYAMLDMARFAAVIAPPAKDAGPTAAATISSSSSRASVSEQPAISSELTWFPTSERATRKPSASSLREAASYMRW